MTEYLTTKKISVVVICYKDEGNIEALYKRLLKVLKETTPRYEIIYVNDASPDTSGKILERLASKDKNLTVLTHARNFGAQAAFTSGMIQASGDAVVLMDGDLQDPPELISKFIEQWKKGYKVVYGTRQQREKSMGAIKQWLYHQFYVCFDKYSYLKIPMDAGDFSLMDRVVVDQINSLPERDRFIRGLRAWVGFKNIGIPYVRPERYDGRPSVSTKGLISAFKWARLAIFGFSYEPLEFITKVAIYSTGISILGILFYLVSYFVKGAPQGFSTIIILILLFASLNFLILSIIGYYIGRIFEEVKSRKKYVIEEILNNHRDQSIDEIHS